MGRSTDRPPRIARAAACLASALMALAAAPASLIAGSAAQEPDPRPKLTVTGEGPLSVKAKSDSPAANTSLIVLNEGPAAVRLEGVTFEASSWTPPAARAPIEARSAGVEVESFSPSTVPAGAARLVVRFDGLDELSGDPVDGQLILRGEGGHVLGARSVSVTPAPQPSADWPLVFFWVGVVLSAALAVVALGALAAHSGLPFRQALHGSAPGPDWTADGWSGKLAAVGGLLAIVVGEITLPSVPREISKETLVQMNVIFVSMLAVGPFIFYALRRRVAHRSWGTAVGLGDMDKKGVWGLKTWLLLSYVITAVAITGQIGALVLLGCEITSGTSWHVVVITIGAVLAALALRSFWVVTYGQAKMNWDAKATAPESPGEEPLKKKHLPIRVSMAE
jgi:hypothetical protein